MTKTTLRRALAPLLLFAASTAAGANSTGVACAAEGSHAGVVVRSSASVDSERSWCISFVEDSLSGIEALRKTGLKVLTKNYGSLGEYVCKIGDVGNDLVDCPARDGSYWGYWRMTPEGWRHSGIGPSAGRVSCGSIDGWVWLQGGTGPAPVPVGIRSICPGRGECPAPAVSPSAGSRPSTQTAPGPLSAGTESVATPEEKGAGRPREISRSPIGSEGKEPAASKGVSANVAGERFSEQTQQPSENEIPQGSSPVPGERSSLKVAVDGDTESWVPYAVFAPVLAALTFVWWRLGRRIARRSQDK